MDTVFELPWAQYHKGDKVQESKSSMIHCYARVSTVPPRSWASHCMSHTSNKVLGTQWIQPRCNTQLSQAPAPPVPPASENCKHRTNPPPQTSVSNNYTGGNYVKEWILKNGDGKKSIVSQCHKTEDNTKVPSHQEYFTISIHQDNLAQTTNLSQKYPKTWKKSKHRNIHNFPDGGIDIQ